MFSSTFRLLHPVAHHFVRAIQYHFLVEFVECLQLEAQLITSIIGSYKYNNLQ